MERTLKMKLQELIKQEKETQQEFLNRTYWNTPKYPPTNKEVHIYKSNKQIHTPGIEPTKKISIQQARDYMETLTNNLPKQKRVKPQEPEIRQKAELIHIATETLGRDELTSQKWMDSVTGEIKHRFG